MGAGRSEGFIIVEETLKVYHLRIVTIWKIIYSLIPFILLKNCSSSSRNLYGAEMLKLLSLTTSNNSLSMIQCWLLIEILMMTCLSV